jgi:uncharacterized protein (TIGR03067 family)
MGKTPRLILATALLSLPGCSHSADPPPPSDAEAIQGAWKITFIDEGDRIHTEESLRVPYKRVFTEDECLFYEQDEVVGRHRYQLHPDQQPKGITFTDLLTGQVSEGIYVLDGDMLKLCRRAQGKGRPTAFEGGRDQVLALHVRLPPAR